MLIGYALKSSFFKVKQHMLRVRLVSVTLRDGPRNLNGPSQTTSVELKAVVLGGHSKPVQEGQPDTLKLVGDYAYIPEVERVQQTEASLSEHCFNLWSRSYNDRTPLRVVRGYIPLRIDSEQYFQSFVRDSELPAKLAKGDILLLSRPHAKCWLAPHTEQHMHGLSFASIGLESPA